MNMDNNWRISDQRLATAEESLREGEFNYPLAAMVGLLVDWEHKFVRALEDAGEFELANTVKRIVHECETGKITRSDIRLSGSKFDS